MVVVEEEEEGRRAAEARAGALEVSSSAKRHCRRPLEASYSPEDTGGGDMFGLRVRVRG